MAYVLEQGKFQADPRINWDWIKDQWINGGMLAGSIADLHESTFGHRPNPSTIKVTASKKKWQRLYRIERDGTVTRLTEEGKPANQLRGSSELTTAVVRNQVGFSQPPAELVPVATRLSITADLIKQAFGTHLADCKDLREKAIQIADEAIRRLETPSQLKTIELQQIATTLERAASIRFKAVETERRILGMDSSDGPDRGTPVTQIQIVNMPNGVQNDVQIIEIEPNDKT